MTTNLRSIPCLVIGALAIALAACNSKQSGPDLTRVGSDSQSVKPSGAPDSSESRVLVESRESPYNNIYVYKVGSNLSMTFGVNRKIYTESVYNPADDTDLPVPYTQFMTMCLIYPRKINSILEIGSGGGRTAWYLHRYFPNVKVTSVELDPMVVEMARKYFGIKDEQNFNVVTRDGRIFLANSSEKYDVILIDAYRGPFVPFHLLTKEFYQLVRAHLTEGGVVAQTIEPSTMLFDSDVNTLHEAFSQVDFYDAWADETGGNTVLIAYNGVPLMGSDLQASAKEVQRKHSLRYDPNQMLARRFTLKMVASGPKPTFDIVNQFGTPTAGIDENAKVLTDDFAPVEALKAIEKHNRRWTTQ